MNHYGNKIRDMCKYSSIEQYAVAEAIGLSAQNFGQHLQKQYPPLELIIKVCKYFRKPLFEFFLEDDEALKEYIPSYLDEEDLEIAKILKTIPQEKRMEILRIYNEILQLVLKFPARRG